MKKHIIVVGGGYAGTNLAHALDGIAKVTLIEPREAFVHNVAAMRSLVSPDLLDQIIIPYDRLLKNGTVLQARVREIDEGSVVLEDGRRIAGDIVVVATGSTYAQPFKPNGVSVTEFRTQQSTLRAAIQAANTIAIIGAGPVGVELAAELATHYPQKKVSLYAASDKVVPRVSDKLSQVLLDQLSKLGIDVHLGAMIEGLQSTDHAFAGTFKVGDQSVSADLIIPVFGARPVLPPMKGLTVKTGRLPVDAWMRPHGYKTVFACGDAADIAEPMTIISVRRQTAWLLKALKAVLKGKSVEKVSPYRPSDKPFLIVPLGTKFGSSVFPFGRTRWLVGPSLTQKLKGRDLFIKKTRKEVGY